jgi:hypothetical protein
MLVHMSPQEVQSLQELAMKNGGSLTINPETGLPEAGFLDSILPILAGMALAPLTAGTSLAFLAATPLATAMTVGGITGLATGSLEKGLMAGFGAYGGAGLGASLTAAGAGTVAAEQLAADQAVKSAAVDFADQAGAMKGAFLPPSSATAFTANPSATDLLSKGFGAATSSGDAALQFGKDNLKYLGAAAVPMMADQMVQTTTQAPAQTSPSKIRQKIYDPISGTYTNVGDVDASQYGNRSFSDIYRGYADGGIVALARGDLIEDTASAGTAAPAYSDQQIQDAIAASRQQGFNNDQILQGAQANYGVDVSRFLSPVTSPPAGGRGNFEYFTPDPDLPEGMMGTMGGAGYDPITGRMDLGSAGGSGYYSATPPAATSGGLDTLAANQQATAVTPGANNATSGTSGDSGVLTLLANQGAAGVTGNTTAAADQQALALQAAQAGINAGKTPEQIAAEVNAKYSKNFTAQNVSDFAAANGIIPQAGSDKYVSNIAAAAAANPNATAAQIQAAMVAQGLNPADVAAAMDKAGLSDAAIYAATNKDFEGTAGGTGLAGLNANIQAAMSSAATAKPDATAAEINALLATYGADASDFKRAMGMTPAEWDAAHGTIINLPAGASVIGGGGNDSIIGGTNNDSITGGTNNDSITGGTGNTSIIGSTGNDVISTTDTVIDGSTVVDTGTSTVGSTTGGTDTGTYVLTETGKVLPVVTLSDGTRLVVNPTQVATNAVTAPTLLDEAGRSTLPVGVGGNQTATINPNGTISMNTGTPNMPEGGYTGMTSLRDAYTKGGGSLGYTPYTPKTVAELNQKYANTGDTKSAYDYLMGKGPYPTKSNVGQIMRPYNEATLGMAPAGNRPTIWDQASGRYIKNPDYVRPMRDSKGEVTYGMSQKELNTFLTGQAKNPTMSGQELYDWVVKNNISAQDIADARGVPLSEVYAQFRGFKQAADAKTATDATATTGVTFDKEGNRVDEFGKIIKGPVTNANGGLMGYAVGGGLGSLGSYSDGGRLLRGPGDGVSDSIPASIGRNQQPARLADGEFVVPARIVSELGNGSTEAGARKLYAMMDRVQRARGKTTGKNRVAANTSADKYLPA